MQTQIVLYVYIFSAIFVGIVGTLNMSRVQKQLFDKYMIKTHNPKTSMMIATFSTIFGVCFSSLTPLFNSILAFNGILNIVSRFFKKK